MQQKQLEVKETVTEKRTEKRTEILEKITTRIEKRFEKWTNWLSQWIDRAKARSAAFKSQGKDTTAADAAITTAQTDLDKAKDLGTTAVSMLKALEPEVWTIQKPAAKAAREAVKTAEQAFVQVLKDLAKVLSELNKLKPEPTRKPTQT